MNKPTAQGASATPADAASRKGLWMSVAAGGCLLAVIAAVAVTGRLQPGTASGPSGSTSVAPTATLATVSSSATDGNTAGNRPPGGLQAVVPTIDGGQYDFAAQVGKPMLLFVSASWCLSCLREVPKLAKLHTTYQNQGLQVVALDLDTNEGAEAWRGFKSRAGGADHIWAMDLADNKITLAMGVTSTDTKIIFNRAGDEVFRTVGPTDYAILDQQVQGALR